ncbi:uncharacterized protein N7500_005326 [Penicillium coprophilum]|uniref:uncharacterized protein n=1 Tax=Penicillium coprophilum TaxID=36646 RepID=UPI002390B995|nr:uncharacterized protein N7500_005326 [Penicillium coprophilum]KAJ5163496.1 hypothetical protein N7500_005326 [Penicillium coprophilum]
MTQYGRSSLYHTSGARDNALTGTNGTAADGKTAVGTAGNALDSLPKWGIFIALKSTFRIMAGTALSST